MSVGIGVCIKQLMTGIVDRQSIHLIEFVFIDHCRDSSKNELTSFVFLRRRRRMKRAQAFQETIGSENIVFLRGNDYR